MNSTQAIQRLRLTLRRQHKAISTESTYTYWLSRYIDAIRLMPPTLSSRQKLESFLSELATRHNVAASTQNQALNAILYFYREVLNQPIQGVDSLRAKRPAHKRHAPTPAQTQALLASVPDLGGHPTNLIARLLYGCGLRVSEPLNLRLKDIQIERGTLCIRGAKGGHDCMVSIPPSLLPELREQINFARSAWQRDHKNKLPLQLPHQLATKFPEYQFSCSWAWLFPAHRPCRHPHGGHRVRYRMHEANLQRAVKIARQKLGLTVLPHELRHGYATHSLERGANPRAIQQAMGHKSLETTMDYLHGESLSVPSPLEALPALSQPSKFDHEMPPVPGPFPPQSGPTSQINLSVHAEREPALPTCISVADHKPSQPPASPVEKPNHLEGLQRGHDKPSEIQNRNTQMLVGIHSHDRGHNQTRSIRETFEQPKEGSAPVNSHLAKRISLTQPKLSHHICFRFSDRPRVYHQGAVL